MKVCPPGLHLSLEIFQRLFNLLEEDCHLLDLKTCSITDSSNTTTFDVYVQVKTAMKALAEEKNKLTAELEQAQGVLVYLLIASPNPQQDQRVLAVTSLINSNTAKVASIVR